MNRCSVVIKCRDLIGRLKSHGIQASRRTRVGQEADEGPDALLVADDGRAWLTAIWEGMTTQPSLAIGVRENAHPAIDEVARTLVDWRRYHRPGEIEDAPELLIIGPSLDACELPASRWHCGGELVSVITRQSCRKTELLARTILSLKGPSLTCGTVDTWRALVVPEVQIATPRRRRATLRGSGGVVAPLLLDYKQERCARLDLEADAGVRGVASDLGVRVITGVAGCGKTLLLVHRAQLLATHFPHSRVLLVSHNRPLIRDLERRVQRSRAGGRIECQTFYKWLAGLVPPTGEMMKPYEVRRWMALQRQDSRYPGLGKFSDEWLIEELNWMFDHDHAAESYLTVVRNGRGIPLTTAQRREVLELARQYRAHLRGTNSTDWSEWPLHVLEQNPPVLQTPSFDHLLIDEAQFFAPVWLRLLTSVLKPGGHLFLCADPTQGFLRRRTSWNEIGLDVRSRSHRLERPYRSTRAILEFARAFYQRRLPNEEEPLNLPSPEWMQTIEPGTQPIVQSGGSHQEQLTRLLSQLRELRALGGSLGDVLILAAGRDQFDKQIVDQLSAGLGAGSAVLMKDRGAPENSAGVVHLMAATGLERPIVFLLGLDDLAAAEANPLLTPEERFGKEVENTRLVYVGLTRAMAKLVVYTSNARLRLAMGIEEGRASIRSRDSHSPLMLMKQPRDS